MEIIYRVQAGDRNAYKSLDLVKQSILVTYSKLNPVIKEEITGNQVCAFIVEHDKPENTSHRIEIAVTVYKIQVFDKVEHF